jgi:Fe-Mn family superoxide dismutase
MKFELPDLPYGYDALAPHLSAATLETHHTKHHAGYLKKLEKAIGATSWADLDLEEIVTRSARDAAKIAVFHNAAQVLNHNLYWTSMSPTGGGDPRDASLRSALESAFGSLGQLRDRFVSAAENLFGSGYVWLVADPASHGAITIEPLEDADNPLVAGRIPLIACDVWEHAYYLDHRNERKKYAELFFDHLVDWEFAARQLGFAATARRERKRA